MKISKLHPTTYRNASFYYEQLYIALLHQLSTNALTGHLVREEMASGNKRKELLFSFALPTPTCDYYFGPFKKDKVCILRSALCEWTKHLSL